MTNVLVLSTPGCPHCRRALEILEGLKREKKDLRVEHVIVTEKPEVLKKYPIMASPGIVIDGKLVSQGGVNERQLRKALGMEDI